MDEEEPAQNPQKEQPVPLRRIKKILRFRRQGKTASQKKGQIDSPESAGRSGMEVHPSEPPIQERTGPKEHMGQPPATGASRIGLSRAALSQGVSRVV